MNKISLLTINNNFNKYYVRKPNLLVAIAALSLLISTVVFGQKNERKVFAPEFKIGGGIGYHLQTISGLTYLTGGLTRKIQLDIQSGLEPTVTFQYQYCFRNKWIIGAEYTLINTDGYDAVKLLLGIRL